MDHYLDRREQAREAFERTGGALEQDGVPPIQIVEALAAELARAAVLVLGEKEAVRYIQSVAFRIPAIAPTPDEGAESCIKGRRNDGQAP